MKNPLLLIISGLAILTACNSDEPKKEEAWTPNNGNCEYIDLGLPSGNLWAYANIGAPVRNPFIEGWGVDYSMKQLGDRYAWGELLNKDVFTPENYEYSLPLSSDDNQYATDGIVANISLTQFDTAHNIWGGDWQMPSRDDFEELINACEQIWSIDDPQYETLILVGPNNKTIFFRLRQCEEGNRRLLAQFWTGETVENDSQNAYALEIDENGIRITTAIPKYEGCYIRPIIKQKN